MEFAGAALFALFFSAKGAGFDLAGLSYIRCTID